MTISEKAEQNVRNYMQSENEKTAKIAKENMLESIETLKTAASFISPINGHDTEQYVKMINCLNRYIKSSLRETERILQKEKDSDIYRHNTTSEAMKLINLLTS